MAVNSSKTREDRSWRVWRNSGSVRFDQNKHPEIREDEVWITNSDDKDFPQIGWETKRRGVVSLDWLGRPLGQRWPGSFPVFAKRSELAKAGVKVTPSYFL